MLISESVYYVASFFVVSRILCDRQSKQKPIIMRNKISIADYVYFLSAKYKVGFPQLIEGLINARDNHEVSCGELSIECRHKAISHDVFLITNDDKVVAQFFVPKYFLNQPHSFGEPTGNHLLKRIIAQNTPENIKQIRDLRFGMKRISLKARVLNVPKATVVLTRYGERARVTNALIADETGTIKLCLWNERADTILANSVVHITNANVTKFRGEKQLTLGRNAELSIIENASFPSSKKIEKEHLLRTAA